MMIQETQKKGGNASYIVEKPYTGTIEKNDFEKEDYPLYLKNSIDDMYSRSLRGEKYENDDLVDFLDKIVEYKFGNSSQTDLLKGELMNILVEDGSIDATEKVSDFIFELSCLGLGDKVCCIVSKQLGLSLLLNKYLDDKTDKYLEDDEIKFIFNMIPESSGENQDDFYKQYQQISQEKDMGVAWEKAAEFVNKLSNLGIEDKICRIVSKQLGLSLLNKCLDDKTDKYLEDDEIEFIFNMIPGISAERSKELYERYKSDVAKVVGLKFVKPEDILITDELKNLSVDKKISDIISKQIELRRYGSRDYYKNKQIFDREGIKGLLNKIQKVTPETIDELYAKYESIIKNKNRRDAANFIGELSKRGADETICDIIQTKFNKNRIRLTAETKGNLIVPKKTYKNTKLFKQRYECGGEFVGKRNYDPSSKKYTLPSSVGLQLM